MAKLLTRFLLSRHPVSGNSDTHWLNCVHTLAKLCFVYMLCSSIGITYSQSSRNMSFRSAPCNPRNSDRGRRTKSSIDDAIARDPTRTAAPSQGKPGRDGNAEKERLASLMQYEGNVPSVKARAGMNTRTKFYCPPENHQANGAAPDRQALLQARFQELSKQVEENQSFLQEMSKNGQAHKYTSQINGEIAEKVREMRQIDDTLASL
jgi:hypothetical protein